MSQKGAERLRGRLQWFETFAYGRIAHQALRTISGIASSGRDKGNLTILERQALTFLRDRVLQAPPTKVLKTSLESWIVFSDGACEGDERKKGTIGAVLVDPLGKVVKYFSETVPQVWMDAFLEGSTHPIFELEVLPVLCSLLVWEPLFKNSQCVFYLDNEAARGALVKASTSTEWGKSMIHQFVLTEMDAQIRVWFTRVPTSSNIADRPSRMDSTELDALGVTRSSVDWAELQSRLERLESGKRGFSQRDS